MKITNQKHMPDGSGAIDFKENWDLGADKPQSVEAAKQAVTKESRGNMKGLLGAGVIGFGSLVGLTGYKLISQETSSEKQLVQVSTDTTEAPADKVITLAAAPEAAAFAGLPLVTQNKIRAVFDDCMDGVYLDVEEETTPEGKQFALDDGFKDCDESRGFDIRRAIADENIRKTTNSIINRG